MTSKLVSISWIALLLCHSYCCGGDSIDSLFAVEHEKHSLTPAPLCSDQPVLRRVTLDLAGRVPSLGEIQAFERRPDRAAKIAELLTSDEFASSWAETWTTM